MAEAACFPSSLTRTFEPFFRCFNGLSLLINPGTTLSFSVIHHYTWGLRGASRGRDQLPLVYFAAIVPGNSPDSVSGDTVFTATKKDLPRVSSLVLSAMTHISGPRHPVTRPVTRGTLTLHLTREIRAINTSTLQQRNASIPDTRPRTARRDKISGGSPSTHAIYHSR